MLVFASEYANVHKFLPDENEIKKAPKQWIVNMIYSLVQEDFADWVRRIINTRN